MSLIARQCLKISLTLLGLYLGRAHVKATIGEEFDLSHWF